MKIPLTEPTSPRYIYVNPKTNAVHLLMPLVSGTEIGLDNTCKSVFAVQEFFGKSRDVHQRAALDELSAYQTALELDIRLIDKNSSLKAQKQNRLVQIKIYIDALKTVITSKVLEDLVKPLPSYPKPLQQIMTADDSNVYSMLLRPKVLDESIRFIKPVFSVNRIGESVFNNALMAVYENISAIPGAKARVFAAVLASPASLTMDFQGLQKQLQEEFYKQFKVQIDFTKRSDGSMLTKEFIDEAMLFDADNPPSSGAYIETLMHYCAKDFFATLVEPVFYSAKHADELSIMTQFFMAQVNIYCRANQISTLNFGTVLDGDSELSTTIAAIVYSCHLSGAHIEDALLDFVNEKHNKFGLIKRSRKRRAQADDTLEPLLPADCAVIKKQFAQHYAQIKETKEFDEFIVLDTRKPGPFISYQNAISLHFSEFTGIGFPELKPDFFKAALADFKSINENIPPNNPWIHQEMELSITELVKQVQTEEQLDILLKKLPPEQQNELLKSPQIRRLQVPKFLHCVARGQQREAEDLLKVDKEWLLHPGTFTDYSGRTFTCTAYEYAYWAKDRHMLRMLEKYIVPDEAIKAEMLKRCEAIERDGLTYIQNGQSKNSKHFDFTPLKTALVTYVEGETHWAFERNWGEIDAAWRKVVKAQEDLPAHVVDEYCRPDRTFSELPDFNEADLPRGARYYNRTTQRDEWWFPLRVSGSGEPDVGLFLYRGNCGEACGVEGSNGEGWLRARYEAPIDWKALTHLDEVRTEDLKHSLENLRSSGALIYT
ncbi:MAG: hypothetical protein ACHP6H_04545 [Legionellales bacterium]